MTIKHIPLDKLDIAPENPRATIRPEHIDKLAASIREVGLKQNLVGYDDGKTVWITAGGCRLLALRKVWDDGENDLSKFKVPVLIEQKDDAIISALTENVVRQDMRTGERVRAYKRLIDEGYTEEHVCKAFQIDKATFKRTMKLADLPQVILDALDREEMTLDHAKAFAAGDPGEALALYEEMEPVGFGVYSAAPHQIRHRLTKEQVSAKTKLGAFVGRKDYEAAGGKVVEDLFGEQVYFTDTELVSQLANHKIAEKCKEIEAEGWKWVEFAENMGWEDLRAYGRVYPAETNKMNDEEYAEYEELSERDDLTNSEADRLEELEAKDKYEVWTDEQKTFSGVVLTIDHYGEPITYPGLVKPEDVKEAIEKGIADADRHNPVESKSEKDPLEWSASVREDVREIRRLAQMSELVEKPTQLLDLLTISLAAAGMRGFDMRARWFDLSVAGSMPPGSLKELCEQGFEPSPRLTTLWDRDHDFAKTLAGCEGVFGITAKQRNSVLAECLASRLTQEAWSCHEPNVRKWWTPNATFFNRLTKDQLTEIICDLGAGQWRKWDKKAEMVEVLTGIFAGTLVEADQDPGTSGRKVIEAAKSWLPPILRPVEDDGDQEEAA